jgi:hypothetical protein
MLNSNQVGGQTSSRFANLDERDRHIEGMSPEERRAYMTPDQSMPVADPYAPDIGYAKHHITEGSPKLRRAAIADRYGEDI